MLQNCGLCEFVEKFPGEILDILPIIVYSYQTKLKPKINHFITIFYYNTNFVKMLFFFTIPFFLTIKNPGESVPELFVLRF
ncbi:hypothetical protein UY9_02411 [Bacillus atrophaeus C89]|nr:hypothetical protein UY9_02411 [Bacillus atrophaeus C89]